jgi:hypothetical protein
MANSEEQSVDLSQTEDASKDKPSEVGKGGAYDPAPLEDIARRRIAYWLLGLLTFICLFSFEVVLMWPEKLDHVMRLLELILSPVIALVSAATGFYYGSKRQG